MIWHWVKETLATDVQPIDKELEFCLLWAYPCACPVRMPFYMSASHWLTAWLSCRTGYLSVCSLDVYESACFTVCKSLRSTICILLSIYLYISLSVSSWLALSMWLSLCLSVCLSLSLRLPTLTMCHCLSLYSSVYLCLPICLPVSLPARMKWAMSPWSHLNICFPGKFSICVSYLGAGDTGDKWHGWQVSLSLLEEVLLRRWFPWQENARINTRTRRCIDSDNDINNNNDKNTTYYYRGRRRTSCSDIDF